VAGAEIIDGDADAGIAVATYLLAHMRPLVQQHALGNLDDDAARIYAVITDHGQPFVAFIGAVAELARRLVDADLQAGMAIAIPDGQLLERSLQDPVAEAPDQAQFLGHADELAGHDQPAQGMAPAYQGLELRRRPRRSDDGLIVQLELIVPHGG